MFKIMEEKIRRILCDSNVHGLQQDILTKDLLVLFNKSFPNNVQASDNKTKESHDKFFGYNIQRIKRLVGKK